MENKTVITRFAPSPTGTLHTGGARTALVDYIYAKQNGGKYILRIDDTDKIRSTTEYEKDMIDKLHWLGIQEDETYRQSDRLNLHKTYLQKLLDEDRAYVSQEEIKEEGQSSSVIRFRNPNKIVTFQDLIRGEVSVDTTDLGDFIIAKNIDTPLYHFASIVDDFELGITDIIRAEEHLPNTPRQILMWEAIGAPLPRFAHIPLILAPDRSKLSKRKHADIASIGEFAKKGYLPEAIINYIAFLGWNPGTDEEIFSLEELVKRFDLSKMQKGGAIFDQTKLDWYNREYLRLLSVEDFITKAEPFLSEIKEIDGYSTEKFKKIIPLLLERIYTFGDLKKMFETNDIQYFFTSPNYSKELLKNPVFLSETIEILTNLPEDNFEIEQIKTALWNFATEKGRGAVLWPMRIALSGQEKSPDPFTLASVLGKTETLIRLNYAQNL